MAPQLPKFPGGINPGDIIKGAEDLGIDVPNPFKGRGPKPDEQGRVPAEFKERTDDYGGKSFEAKGRSQPVAGGPLSNTDISVDQNGNVRVAVDKDGNGTPETVTRVTPDGKLFKTGPGGKEVAIENPELAAKIQQAGRDAVALAVNEKGKTTEKKPMLTGAELDVLAGLAEQAQIPAAPAKSGRGK